MSETFDSGDIAEKRVVVEEIPEILSGGGKPALYVGASAWRAYMLGDLVRWGWQPEVLEIWPENVYFVKRAWGFPVIQGDVATIPLARIYGLCLWWHGPEHIRKEDLPSTLAKLEAQCDIVVLGCLAGHDPQPVLYGNSCEGHLWDVSPDDFRALGYSVRVEPRPNHSPNITAWKRVR